MRKTLLSAGAVLVTAITMTAAPALAGPATGSETVGQGSVIVAKFHQNIDGSGYSYTSYDTASCTATTGDVNFDKNTMYESDWDNATSYIRDYNSCDVKIYRYINQDTALTGWVNYGSGGQSLEGALNNLTSSYYLS